MVVSVDLTACDPHPDEQPAPHPGGAEAQHLRVALASDWFLPRLGGIEMQLADLARGLAAQGHDVDVLTSTPGPEHMDGVRVRRIPVRLAPHFGFAISPALTGTLEAAFARGRYDIVHAHISIVSPVGYAAVLAARRLGIPVVATFHSVLAATPDILHALDRVLRWSRWPLILSAVSERVAQQLRRAAPGREVIVLPNGLDPAFWRVTPPPMPRSGSDRVAVTAMRLTSRKRPLALLRAFRRAQAAVAAQGRRLRLRIAGDGPERAKLQRFIDRHRLADDVTLLGVRSREELRALYAAADLFVLPSLRESFGIAAIEARAAGLPVIAMETSGAVEFLRHEHTALIASDDAELAAHLTRLTTDDALRARLAPPDAGLARYAWPAVVAAHLACYARATALTDAQQTCRPAPDDRVAERAV